MLPYFVAGAAGDGQKHECVQLVLGHAQVIPQGLRIAQIVLQERLEFVVCLVNANNELGICVHFRDQ